MVEQQLIGPGGATEVTLAAILAELLPKLEENGTVNLSAATLAALENIAVTGTVALDAPTLAALENITVSVANWPSDYPDAAVLAKLEQVRVLLAAPLAVTGPLTDAELRATDVEVDVTNFPADYPLPAAQVTTLTPQTDGLTDTELRAADVNVADSGERLYTHVVATVTASGDTTVHTPAAGKAIRLRWIYAINDPAATSPPLIKVKLGSTEIYRVWALSKRQLVLGAVNASLVINLTGGGTVAVTAILEEI